MEAATEREGELEGKHPLNKEWLGFRLTEEQGDMNWNKLSPVRHVNLMNTVSYLQL